MSEALRVVHQVAGCRVTDLVAWNDMERQADYINLENRALAILATQVAPDSQHETLISYVSLLPSLGNYSAWTVFSNHAETEFVVRRTDWDRHFDGSRFRDPFMGLKYGWGTTPTFTSAAESLHYGETISLLSEAKALEFSESTTKAPIVLDGTNWQVFVSGAFGDKPQRWNWQPPQWKAMIDWTQRWVDFLEGHFEAKKEC